MEEIQTLIRNERIRQKLSVAQLAKLTGVSSRTIQYWESGEHEISLNNADKILKALGISLTIGKKLN